MKRSAMEASEMQRRSVEARLRREGAAATRRRMTRMSRAYWAARRAEKAAALPVAKKS